MNLQQLKVSSIKDISVPNAIDRNILSICPLSQEIVNAKIFRENDADIIEKGCEIHGDFNGIYWSEAENLFKKFMYYWHDGEGIFGIVRILGDCPFKLWLICECHKTNTILGNIDIIDRCNLSCPIRSADSGNGSEEPTLHQIENIMKALRALESNGRLIPFCSYNNIHRFQLSSNVAKDST
jgi:uncharacterized radical SAM superfamily Fe-S cluster-containing enzyme